MGNTRFISFLNLAIILLIFSFYMQAKIFLPLLIFTWFLAGTVLSLAHKRGFCILVKITGLTNLFLLFFIISDALVDWDLMHELDYSSSVLVLLADYFFRLHGYGILFLMASAALLLAYLRIRRDPEILPAMALFFVTLLICLLILEASARLANPEKQHSTWSCGEKGRRFDMVGEIEVKDMGGRQFKPEDVVTTILGENGFRMWGDTSTDKKKVLVLGDSNTLMVYVWPNQTWFHHLSREFQQSEFFVHGCWGYGTIQQYLVLEKYYDEVRPDLILWQFCSNDYLDNYRPLMYDHPLLHETHYRPYLEGDKIVTRPVREHPFGRHSRLVAKAFETYIEFYMKSYNYFMGNHPGDYSIWYMKALNPKLLYTYDKFPKARQDTVKAFQMAKDLVGDTPIYMFNPCFDDENSDNEQYLCDQAGLNCINDAYSHLAEKNKDTGVFLEIGHPNVLGNRILGEYLSAYFKNNSMLE